MPKSVKKAATKLTTREIVYSEITVGKCVDSQVLTAELCKDLLGWSDKPLDTKPDEPPLFVQDSTKIWCHNNVNADYTNRGLTWGNVIALKQEILNRRWRFNGETIIIGRTACILNGQHQMIALVLAVLEWETNKEKWTKWKSEPVIEKIIVYGIEETDDVVNTMDTCKPRTFDDVIFRSETFSKMATSDKKLCSKILAHATKLLWHRLGVSNNAFAPRQTHSEGLDFIVKHPTLLKCVKHIYEENKGDKHIQKVITPGYATAMMYLMACSKTDPKIYHDVDNPQESLCDVTNYDLAKEFFVGISGQSKSFAPLLDAARNIEHQTRDAKLALIAKAWMLFVAGSKISKEGIKLSLDENYKVLECPTVGGIDKGNPKEDHAGDEPSEAEKNGHKETESAIRDEKTNGSKPVEKKGFGTKPAQGKPAVKKTSKKSGIPEVGSTVYVSEDGGYWEGELIEIYEANGKRVGKVKDLRGKTFDTPLENCSLSEPDM